MATQQNTTKIVRSVNTTKHNFTPISNELIQNTKLTLEARALVMFIISLPENWTIYKQQVQRALNMNRVKFNRVWKECVDSGYIKVIKERAALGRFNYHYLITDRLTDGGLSACRLSACGEPVAKEKKEEEKIYQEKNIQEKNSSLPGNSTSSFADIFNLNTSTQDILNYINN
jgi:predicted transcriptional regulator